MAREVVTSSNRESVALHFCEGAFGVEDSLRCAVLRCVTNTLASRADDVLHGSMSDVPLLSALRSHLLARLGDCLRTVLVDFDHGAVLLLGAAYDLLPPRLRSIDP